MEVNFKKGDRIVITMMDSTIYEANLESYCDETEILNISNVILYLKNKPVQKNMELHMDDVSELKSLAEYVPPKGVRKPRYLKRISKGDYFKLLNLQRCFRFINTTYSTYYAAMNDLQKSKMVAVCGKGVVVERRRRLSVLAFATDNGVYVFDMERLGSKVFDEGLRNVLESESIVKVVYDCRFLSDCLFYKHRIQLNNIRDVEAEDVLNVYHETGCIRKNTRPLSHLIQLYLGLSNPTVDEDLITEPKRLSRDVKLQSFLANYVSYLIPIHKSIESIYLQRLTDVSKLYSEAFRNSNDFCYGIKTNKHVLVKEIKNFLKPKETLNETE